MVKKTNRFPNTQKNVCLKIVRKKRQHRFIFLLMCREFVLCVCFAFTPYRWAWEDWREVPSLGGAVQAAKLDPGLKATWFQKFNLMKNKISFDLKLNFWAYLLTYLLTYLPYLPYWFSELAAATAGSRRTQKTASASLWYTTAPAATPFRLALRCSRRRWTRRGSARMSDTQPNIWTWRRLTCENNIICTSILLLGSGVGKWYGKVTQLPKSE